MSIKKLLVGIVSISVIFNPYYVFADEIVVSGNGEGSTNNVNVNVSQNTQTQQNNSANITNNVTVDANTGNNTANQNNGGDTNITTGDVNATSQITNSGINQSTVETGCCGNDLGINISGNGSGSSNNINYATGGNTNVSVNNNANIYNSVHGYANTGNNTANQNNGGSVTIATGNIYATDTIKNNSINVYGVKASNGGGGSVYISIDGNGADSSNSIVFENNNDLDIDVQNSAKIVNNSVWDLNTGNNEANGNNGGDVAIKTGDIVFVSTIENTDTNIGLVDVECCEKNHGNPPESNPPSSNPPSGSGGGSSNGSSSSSGGPIAQTVLPVTGSPSLLVLAVANVIMFFLGWYLRLRSGRSPNLARR